MADFVEQAVLQVTDESSKQITAINKKLRELLKTARELRNVKIEIDGLSTAERQVKELSAAIRAVPASKSVRVRLTGVAEVTRQLAAFETPRAVQLDISLIGEKSVLSMLEKLDNNRTAFIGVDGVVRAKEELAGIQAILTGMHRQRYKININSIQVQTALGRVNSILERLDRIDARSAVNIHTNYTQSGVPPVPPPPGGRVSGGGGNRTPGGGGNISPNRNSFFPPVQINHVPLVRFLDAFLITLGFTIVNAITEGFRRGTGTMDAAQTRLETLNISPDGMQIIQQGVNELENDAYYGAFTRGEISAIAAEVYPVTRNDASLVQPIVVELLDFANIRLATDQNLDTETALNNILLVLKAGEQSGAITNVDGSVDIPRLQSFFDLITQATIIGGREIDPGLIAKIYRNLGTSKFTLDENGIMMALLLGEEMGPSAAVGINQMIKQLSGEGTTVRARNNQEAFGLRGPQTVEPGEYGNTTDAAIEITASVDDAMLRADSLQYVIDYVLPAMKENNFVSDATDPDIRRSEDGLMASRFANLVTSTKTATNTLTALIVRAQELERDAETARAIPVDPETMRRNLEDSVLKTFADAVGDTSSALGDLGTSLESLVIPALQDWAGWMRSISNMFEDEDGNVRQIGSREATGYGLAGLGAIIAGAFALRGVRSLFNPQVWATNANTAALIANTAALGGTAVADIVTDTSGKGRWAAFLSSVLPRVTAAAALVTLKGDSFDPEGYGAMTTEEQAAARREVRPVNMPAVLPPFSGVAIPEAKVEVFIDDQLAPDAEPNQYQTINDFYETLIASDAALSLPSDSPDPLKAIQDLQEYIEAVKTDFTLRETDATATPFPTDIPMNSADPLKAVQDLQEYIEAVKTDFTLRPDNNDAIFPALVQQSEKVFSEKTISTESVVIKPEQYPTSITQTFFGGEMKDTQPMRKAPPQASMGVQEGLGQYLPEPSFSFKEFLREFERLPPPAETFTPPDAVVPPPLGTPPPITLEGISTIQDALDYVQNMEPGHQPYGQDAIREFMETLPQFPDLKDFFPELYPDSQPAMPETKVEETSFTEANFFPKVVETENLQQNTESTVILASATAAVPTTQEIGAAAIPVPQTITNFEQIRERSVEASPSPTLETIADIPEFNFDIFSLSDGAVDLDAVLSTNAYELQTTFATGADNFGAKIDASSVTFGSVAADGFLALAPQIGLAIGLAAAEQLRNLTVTARPPRAAPIMSDLGSAGPY